MAQLSISLPDDLAEQVRYYADRNGYATVSDLVRESLRGTINPMKLTFWDRAQLVRTLEMYAKIMDADTSGEIAALRGGFTRDYLTHFQDISTTELPAEVSRLVLDVFGCYDDLQRSAKPVNNPILSDHVLFSGYDGHCESEYIGYSNFVRGTNRYKFIDVRDDLLDSHAPMVLKYRRMLEKWNAVRATKPNRDNLLSKDEIKAVISA